DAAWRSKGEVGRHWASIAAAVLGCRALQWFGWLIPGQYGQFLFWSGTLLILILVLLVLSIVGPPGRLRPSQ
ncbi:MAG TPA: hypothetical protein VLS88_17605, partial [Polyangiales bacterium]|nr:hypothetical protein [Polyangiales bacterium]